MQGLPIVMRIQSRGLPPVCAVPGGLGALGGAVLVALLCGSVRGSDFDHTHRLFDHVLATRVKDGLVDYAALKANPRELNDYLDQLASVPEASFDQWTQPQKLAFQINLYNATTLRLILNHYPVKSIKKIGSLFSGPWDKPVVRLFGRSLSLDALEHERLRVQFDEPRIHFALVCAARSCPPLRAEAYTGAKLEQQLEELGRLFLRMEQKNSVDLKTRTLHLSPIFKWFAEDFQRRSGSVQKFVAPYFPDELRRELQKGDFRIKYTDYDWSLNDAAMSAR